MINKLLLVVGNDTPANDKKFVELDLSLDPVIENEEKYHPIDQCFFIRSEKTKSEIWHQKINQAHWPFLFSIPYF